MELYFLTEEDVIKIHDDQIKRYGGKPGLRNRSLLLSAIEQPFCTFDGQYLHNTIAKKAAAYLFHLCQNHPFIDGNKRTALVSALMFLAINNYPYDFDESAIEQLVWNIAAGKIKKEEIALFFSNSRG